jgi:hypothetical protein
MDKRHLAIGALIAALSGCVDKGRPPLPEPADNNAAAARQAFNPPDAIGRASTEAEPDASPTMSQDAGPALDERAALGNESGFSWRNLRYPVAIGESSSIDSYLVNRRSDTGVYTIRTGAVLNVPQGAYIRYHKDMYRFGEWIRETKVVASSDTAPENFPQCGKHVVLRHRLNENIPGIGDDVYTIYCNLDIRAVRDNETVPDNAPDGGAVIGTVGRREGGRQPDGQLLFLVRTGSLDAYNTTTHPFSLLRSR